MSAHPSPSSAAQAGKFLLRLLVTVAILFFILRSIDAPQVWQTLMQASPWLLLAALLLQLGSSIVAAYRWQLVMHNLDFGQTFAFYWRSFFKGLFFNQGLPTSIGGDALRVLDVAGRGFRKRDALYAIVIDRVAGLGALLLLTLFACAANPALLPENLYRLIFLLVAAGLLGLLGGYVAGKHAWFKPYPRLAMVQLLADRMHQAVSAHRLQLLLSSLLVPVLALLGFFATGRALGLPYDAMTYFAIVPLTLVLSIVPVSIAGWGVREGAMVGLFSLIGADKTAVLMMSLLYGIMLIVVSLPGLVVFLQGRHRKNHKN
ncbi:MAG: lysylphosphatidylglycerol synthase transmembrane domain-containing protein [Rugosibacter sp.]